MPADDAVSPMQGDRYPTGYIRRPDAAASGHDLAAEKLLHPDAMGVLVPGRDKHFYSSGAFNLIQLIFYILRQTGPAHLCLPPIPSPWTALRRFIGRWKRASCCQCGS